MKPKLARCIALWVLSVFAAGFGGCRIEPAPGAPLGDPSGNDNTDSEPGGPGDAPSSGGNGANGGGSAARGGAGARGGTASTEPNGDDGPGGANGEPPLGACDGQAVSLDELRAGLVRPGAAIALSLTATSQKFLLSQTQAGNCLWGIFLGLARAVDEPLGLLVVSYGDELGNATSCHPGTDAIPDDLAPGDSVNVVGRFSPFVPSACDGIAPSPQLTVDAQCPFEVTGHGAPLAPVVMSLEIADELAHGTDPELLARWASGLVTLENVSGLAADTGDGIVGPYGVVRLAETALEVHADIEYGDLTAAGPRDPSKSLAFDYPTTFRSITGLVYLDYCTWSLAPRTRCTDFDPPSAGCSPGD